jgi:putative endonuclease
MYYVYLLKLNDGSIYTGSTPDLKKRIKEHNNGKCESTKNFRPVELVWFCAFRTRLQARRFEDYLKSGSGQAFRNKRLVWIEGSTLSKKCHFQNTTKNTPRFLARRSKKD